MAKAVSNYEQIWMYVVVGLWFVNAFATAFDLVTSWKTKCQKKMSCDKSWFS